VSLDRRHGAVSVGEPQAAGSRLAGRLARLAVGLAVAGWLLARAEPERVLEALARTHAGWVVAAVALVLVDRTLMALRWLWLLEAVGVGRHLPTGAVMRIFFVSTFLGTFLPGSVGGDAVRTLSLSRLNVAPAEALASVVVDRILGTLSILLMGVGGLIVVRSAMGGRTLPIVAGVSALVLVLALLLLFDSRLLAGVTRTVTGSRFPGLGRRIGRVLDAIRQYGYHRRTLAWVLGLSLAVQVLRVLQAWALGSSLGLDVAVVWYFAFVPVIVLIMALPISVGGLGTSQFGFVFFLAIVGVADADAFALSILFLGLGALGNLPGGLLFMLGPGRPQASRPGA